MAARKYKPGNPAKYKPKGTGGRFSDLREVWARLTGLEVVMFRQPTQEGAEELGDGVSLFLKAGSQRPLTIKLATWTREELDAFRTVVNRALDEAAPICTRRDEIAQKAYEAGDDSYERIYRPVPQVVDRTGKEREHDQGVQG